MSSRAGSGRWFDVVNQAGEIKRPSEERDRVWIIADGKCAGVDISCLVEFVLLDRIKVEGGRFAMSF
ncbi:Uncharacterized protein HZ326_23675, partial [Fusarium oxysporum f. sp. albedinis]